jgi:murein DD-endopeptidase MepM/ murein hydrolase activator NlpD
VSRYLCLLTFTALAITSCSQLETNVPFHHYGTNKSGGSLGIHTFRKNDTLWSVSNAYRVDLREMLDINHLSAPYRIQVGQRLKIPAPTQYVAKPGDTIYKVSRLFDTTTTEIVRMNNLKKPYRLKVGQDLRLPSKVQKSQEAQDKKVIVSDIVSGQKVATVDREILPPIKEKHQQEEIIQSSIIKSDTKTTHNNSGKLSFIKPVSGQIISGYGPKSDGLHNDGINIKAAKGDAVRAAETGVVVYTGQEIEGYGKMVLIRHHGEYLTAYAHMDKILAKNGDKIKRGQVIGTVGATGNVKSPQLHFEIRKGRDAINPRTKLQI